jgi:hypothetical protein
MHPSTYKLFWTRTSYEGLEPNQQIESPEDIRQNKKSNQNGRLFICKHVPETLAGDEGFEPPITGPEPVALPLGQSPLTGRL